MSRRHRHLCHHTSHHTITIIGPSSPSSSPSSSPTSKLPLAHCWCSLGTCPGRCDGTVDHDAAGGCCCCCCCWLLRN